MKSSSLTHETLKECRQKLLIMKQDILNRVRASAQTFSQSRFSETTHGDEADQSVAQLEEHQFLIAQKRMRDQLLEIEQALSRMENGSFGVCEETDEVIEEERLIAIPWTRLSIEGAEIREALTRKFAR